MSTFQRLYDSEINFSITCFWDGGFEVKLGDDLNGIAAETRVMSWEEIEPWLSMQALLHYPESDFAKARLAQGGAA
jgi:hypothetical protein